MITARCPICDRLMKGNAADWPCLPFCGKRCRGIDLGRWLGEAYRTPAVEAREEPPEERLDERDIP
jgi:endogenous inhibitor of DNA gyrase (YacG/DUF329 family)